MKHAVLFDLDETLFDRTGSLRLFLADQIKRLNLSVFRDQETTIRRFLELDNRGRTQKTEVYSTMLLERGVKDVALVSALFEDYENNAWRFARGFDGLAETLNTIRESGWKTGVISNGQTHIQLRSLLALNLDRLLDIYLISESVGLRKPDSKIFLLAAKRLSVDPENCVFVGDTPEADIAGAQKVGMKTVWFPNGALWPEDLTTLPDAEIHSLKELCTVLSRLKSNN